MRGRQEYSFLLCEQAIDEASDWIFSTLAEERMMRQDALLARLSLEDVLTAYLPLARGAACTIGMESRRSSVLFRLCVEGPQLDPFVSAAEGALGSYESGQYMLGHLGLGNTYRYQNGVNQITQTFPKKRRSILLPTGICAAIGLLLGFLLKNYTPDAGEAFLNALVNPAFDAFFGLLICVVGPMMFLSVVLGIYNVGDTRQLGSIGLRLVLRFLVTSLLIGAFVLGVSLLFFAPPGGAANARQAQWDGIVGMLLDIIPSNIITPFQAGNTMQIIFLAVVLGIAMSTLRERVRGLADTLNQLSLAIQRIVSATSVMVPALVLLILLRTMMTEGAAHLLGAVKAAAVIIGCQAIVLLVLTCIASLRVKMPIGLLTRKLLPTFILGFTTASTTLALVPAMESCKKDLGMDAKLVDFGMPLGFVLFKIGCTVTFICISIFGADAYGVPMGLAQYVMVILISVILAVAVPLVPGGMLSCFTLLFLQFGIPLEALAAAAAVNVFVDFSCGGFTPSCNQLVLLRAAKSLNMLKTPHKEAG